MKDDDLNNFLSELVLSGCLEGAALGITKIVIEKGEAFLTEKQSYVFRKHVLKPNTIPICSGCCQTIPWSEMFLAMDSGFCGYCLHRLEKDD